MHEISRDIRQTILPFVVWGFVIGILLPYVPDGFRPQASQLVLDSVAVNTVKLFLYFSMLGCGVFMAIFGVVDDENTLHHRLYDWLVRRPIRFGMTFAAVAVGILIGVALSAFCHWQPATGLNFLGGSIAMVVAYTEMYLLARLVEGPMPRARRIIYARLAGLLMLAMLPIVVWIGSANAS